MKKIGILLLMGLFLAGCGAAAKESGFWEHDTMYKNWAHLGYSWFGYKKPTIETGKKSAEQGWWGIPEEIEVSKLKSEHDPMRNPEEQFVRHQNTSRPSTIFRSYGVNKDAKAQRFSGFFVTENHVIRH